MGYSRHIEIPGVSSRHFSEHKVLMECAVCFELHTIAVQIRQGRGLHSPTIHIDSYPTRVTCLRHGDI